MLDAGNRMFDRPEKLRQSLQNTPQGSDCKIVSSAASEGEPQRARRSAVAPVTFLMSKQCTGMTIRATRCRAPGDQKTWSVAEWPQGAREAEQQKARGSLGVENRCVVSFTFFSGSIVTSAANFGSKLTDVCIGLH